MSKENKDKKASASELDKEKDEMLFNPVDKEERSKRNPTEEEDEMDQFNVWTKKYNRLSKEIRKNAVEEEKKELEGLEKSPLVKHYEGSRAERIQALEREQKQIEEMEKKRKTKK